MRIFVAGASGVIGLQLLPLLHTGGYEIAGMTRTNSKVDQLKSLGVEPVVCNVFNLEALSKALMKFRPNLVLHELTDLPDEISRISEFSSANSQIRRLGTRNLLTASDAAGVERFVAQSVAWSIPGDGGVAVAEHEQAVLNFGGVVLRYGQFYGPGTYFESEPPSHPRIHIVEAARRTLDWLDAPSGIINITED